jgi:ankyrin repeat protein
MVMNRSGLFMAGLVGWVALLPGTWAASGAGVVEPAVQAVAAHPQGAPALVDAVERGDNELVSVLLSKGANPETTDHRGRTLLMLAALHGKPALVAMLIELKANANALADGLTPMIAAAMWGDPETVALLIKAGANVNYDAGYYSTPISYARTALQVAPAKRPARSAQGALEFAAKADYEAVIRLLVAAGAK